MEFTLLIEYFVMEGNKYFIS